MANCCCHAAIVMVLRREFRFGEKRLIKVLEGMAKELEPIGNGMIGWRDYLEYVKDTVGVNIVEPELYKKGLELNE